MPGEQTIASNERGWIGNFWLICIDMIVLVVVLHGFCVRVQSEVSNTIKAVFNVVEWRLSLTEWIIDEFCGGWSHFYDKLVRSLPNEPNLNLRLWIHSRAASITIFRHPVKLNDGSLKGIIAKHSVIFQPFFSSMCLPIVHHIQLVTLQAGVRFALTFK